MTETDPAAPVPQPSTPPPTAPPAPEPPPRKSRTGSFLFGMFSGCLIVFVGFLFFTLLYTATRSSRVSGDIFSTQKVAVIPIEGEIVEARGTVDLLHQYADSGMVRAIVLRINSPGGGVAASQEIYEEIRKVRSRSGKPIVASIDDVGASGAFYIASACDEIVCNPGSIVGSIGVIMQWFNVQDLLNWAKIHPETITSGALKDTGSPFRPMTDVERAYLQRISDQLHDQFVHAVAEGRKGKLTEQDVTRIADGRVFTGQDALDLKLVDRLGNLDDAIDVAARLAGIHGTPTTIYPRKQKPSLLELLTDTNIKTDLDRVLSRHVGFLYRW